MRAYVKTCFRLDDFKTDLPVAELSNSVATQQVVGSPALTLYIFISPHRKHRRPITSVQLDSHGSVCLLKGTSSFSCCPPWRLRGHFASNWEFDWLLWKSYEQFSTVPTSCHFHSHSEIQLQDPKAWNQTTNLPTGGHLPLKRTPY